MLLYMCEIIHLWPRILVDVPCGLLQLFVVVPCGSLAVAFGI